MRELATMRGATIVTVMAGVVVVVVDTQVAGRLLMLLLLQGRAIHGSTRTTRLIIRHLTTQLILAKAHTSSMDMCHAHHNTPKATDSNRTSQQTTQELLGGIIVHIDFSQAKPTSPCRMMLVESTMSILFVRMMIL